MTGWKIFYFIVAFLFLFVGIKEMQIWNIVTGIIFGILFLISK